MPTKLITPPTGLPVTRDELVKVHIKVDGTDEDLLLDAYLAAATELVQNYIQRQLMQATYELNMSHWHQYRHNYIQGVSPYFIGAFNGCNNHIVINKAPLIEVLSIKYDDVTGAEQTMTTDQYKVDNVVEPGKIFLTGTLPNVADAPNCIRIQYKAGYGATVDDETAQRIAVPNLAKVAILRTVADLYENRQDETIGTTPGMLQKNVEYLLSTLRLFL